MNPNIKPDQRCTLLGVIDPDANTAAAYSTAYVNAGLYESTMALIAAGDLGTNATIDAKLEQAVDSSGTSKKDVTGKAITQLTDAGSDSNKQVIINCKSEDLDVANGFCWVRLTVTVGTATSDSAAFLFGLDARYTPAAAASVDEVVG